MEAIKNPEWLDTQVYPFENKYLEVNGHEMHYIEEGEGPVLLFVHGTPVWSFLYRHLIRALSKNYRCIAIDHIGFGLSEKPKDFEGTPQAHAENLEAFIQKKALKDITLFVHDFGGPIGLAYANAHPQNISKIVLFNTWLWSLKENPDAQKVDRVINTFIGKGLYLYLNFSPRFLLKQGFSDSSKLTAALHAQYKKPFPNKDSRYGLYCIAQALVGASDFYATQWAELENLDALPKLIIWGKEDQFLDTSFLKKWKKRWPEANTHELNCGHFLQEEKPEEVLRLVQNFLRNGEIGNSV